MRGQKVLTWRNYPAGSAPAEGLPGTVEIERPTARPTLEGMVLVPFFQALIIGVVAGLLLTWLLVDVLSWVDGWWPTWWVAVLTCFGLAFMVKVGACEATLWQVERIIGADITGDQVIGKPPEAHLVTLTGPGASTLTPEERKRAEFVSFVRGVEATGDGGYERWEPVLGRDTYTEFRDALLRCGLAEWGDVDNHRLGWRLTCPAEAIVQAVM